MLFLYVLSPTPYTLAEETQVSDPDLQFDAFILPEDSLDFKVDANSTNKCWRKWVIGIAE